MINDILLGLVVVISLVTDLKEQKIYNKVVFPGIMAGFILNFYFMGWPGLLFSFKGLIVGMALLFIPFAMGAMKAGDVKLLGAIGAIKGMEFVFYTFVATSIAGGFIALIIFISRKKFLTILKRLGSGLYTIFITRNMDALKNIEEKSEGYFPYGLAITAGTALALLVR